MDIDSTHLAKVLSDTANQIREMKGGKTDPMQLLSLGQNISTLQSLGDLKDIQAKEGDETNDLLKAIDHFLFTLADTKDLQEEVAAFLGPSLTQDTVAGFTKNLEQVKKTLLRGRKVEPGEQGGIV